MYIIGGIAIFSLLFGIFFFLLFIIPKQLKNQNSNMLLLRKDFEEKIHKLDETSLDNIISKLSPLSSMDRYRALIREDLVPDLGVNYYSVGSARFQQLLEEKHRRKGSNDDTLLPKANTLGTVLQDIGDVFKETYK